uniref:Threonine--tRNA ligase n=1 Tax=candidate division WOR-3 bacterium TaxID=2052148 RepID=A0A7C4TGT4_UNCW3
MLKVKLNGREMEVEAGKKISDLVAEKEFVAARINGVLKDLSSPITEDSEIDLLRISDPEAQQIFWHSTAHIMAMAVKSLFPDTKLAIGPAIEQGFYYDFDSAQPFSTEDLVRIEEKMAEIIKEDIPFERIVMAKEAVIEFYTRRSEPYKVELAREIPDKEISLYRNGEFVDLCRGPHIPRTGMVKAFKLLGVAGAYWRGDASQPMLSRIYGISFATEEELSDYLRRLKEAEKRDHRKLGKELELFSIFDEAGAGLVFWHPKGTIIKRLIEEYWIREHQKNGYKIISTPHIARGNLWHQSGHYDFYRDKMYTLKVENEEYVLKPMNCPGHILIYKSKVRSYRELPIKYAELATVYRNELSGTLHGLLRVRGFTQDDAHIFCRPDQIEEEIVRILKLTLTIFKKFGFEEFQVNLSVRDPKEKEKYMGSDEEWKRAEDGLASALKRVNLEYKVQPGEAVFYGPKIDIHILDALGRAWQATTIQFDFNLPKRFNIEYMDADGGHKEVVVIHRAIYGSLERFIGTLIEHYGGAFPFWLAPVQIVVMPITDKENKYAREVFNKLSKQNFRVELNDKSMKINYRIREAEVHKVPYILVLGPKEVEKNSVSVRKRGRGNLGEMKLKDFINICESEQGGED